jgi:hypothetical protein
MVKPFRALKLRTQLRQRVADFDEIIEPTHSDFKTSGLKAPSLIRLGFHPIHLQIEL